VIEIIKDAVQIEQVSYW